MYYVVIVLIILVLFLLPTYKKPVVYRQLITDEERQHIMKVAEGKLSSSQVGKKEINTSIRDSQTAWLSADDPVVRQVIQKCMSRCDRPLRNCEDLQVLRYKQGGFYKPHYDACHDPKVCPERDYANKRLYTFIIALTDDYEGGHTSFPTLDKKYKLKAGDVLKFNNLDNYGLVCGKALHAGEPVISGDKWICNLWVHRHPYKG